VLLRRWAPIAEPVPVRARWALLTRLLVFVAAIVAASAAAIAYSVDRLKDIELLRLQAVAELKVDQLTTWLGERSSDARLIATGAQVSEAYRSWQDRGKLASRDDLFQHLAEMRTRSMFAAISLFDESGRFLWQSDAIGLTETAYSPDKLQAIALQREVQRLGPYRDSQGDMRTDIVLPLGWPAGQPAPLLIFHLRGPSYLPARLREWPIPTRTGEVVLVRRDAGEVVALHALNQAPDAALRMRWPLDHPRLLAAQLVRTGGQGSQALDGIGYQGVPAFGAGRPVPGSDWFLLAKTDHSEIYAAALEDAGWIVLSGALALLMGLLVFRMARERQVLAASARTQAAQRERLQALQLLAAVSDSSDDAIFAKDPQGRYTLFNAAASRFVGKPASEVLGRDDQSLFPADQARLLRQADQRAIERGSGILVRPPGAAADAARRSGTRSVRPPPGDARDRRARAADRP
jgi:PAS domain-containing protein